MRGGTVSADPFIFRRTGFPLSRLINADTPTVVMSFPTEWTKPSKLLASIIILLRFMEVFSVSPIKPMWKLRMVLQKLGASAQAIGILILLVPLFISLSIMSQLYRILLLNGNMYPLNGQQKQISVSYTHLTLPTKRI